MSIPNKVSLNQTLTRPDNSVQISVRAVTADDLVEWDDYVARSDDATFFHRGGWYRVIRDSFNHTPHYLWAVDSTGEIRGILPLFEIKSMLFGHSLASVPFGVYGGAVADSIEVRRSLEDYAAVLAQDLDVDYLELRNMEATRNDWPAKSLHATFRREIEESEEAILLGVKNKQRAVIRKALRNNLSRELQDDVDDFFYAYSVSVRNLGTPVFSRRYFQNLKKEFGQDCEILSINGEGGLHCSLISFYFKETVLPYYGGGLSVSRQSKAMDFMYYDLMCRAGKAGYRTFDFGRSKIDSGPYNYKRHWGFTPQLLHYQYFLVKSDELPELNTANPKFGMMISAWQKLPLKVSQKLGPLVSKYLG